MVWSGPVCLKWNKPMKPDRNRTRSDFGNTKPNLHQWHHSSKNPRLTRQRDAQKGNIFDGAHSCWILQALTQSLLLTPMFSRVQLKMVITRQMLATMAYIVLGTPCNVKISIKTVFSCENTLKLGNIGCSNTRFKGIENAVLTSYNALYADKNSRSNLSYKNVILKECHLSPGRKL